jgi:hypothetical protein
MMRSRPRRESISKGKPKEVPGVKIGVLNRLSEVGIEGVEENGVKMKARVRCLEAL